MKKDKQKKVYMKLKDSIATYDGFIDPKLCQNLIDLFEKYKDLKAYDRLKGEGATAINKKDEAIGFTKHNNWPDEIEAICANIREMLDLYVQKTDIMNFSGIREFNFTSVKIQKTQPGGGYHVWHIERSHHDLTCKRALVWTVYLNDIKEGGETEFLNQNQRVPAKRGRACIFPADFPYVHRGNPPLKEDKYIVTSWLLSS